ncbi:tRNA N6-adenosine threonylcarbamoyltransferase [bacterium BMS3Abin07]|nr:tRNA N6-adenosine threonylcarbamoyltransferase [bacterium BMS3Abin07]GBE32645.1 tRNA N6-adenosine threonylcarbamoyltransferase [bacterium BMS3Bbin05]HDL21190.1 tRNA (adenosine(37)-N6)-threonylcarbamoyltransferase complex transferase subunit TsaD [Nitrospirota bacterium]HDO23285.1 tRNA (adenosine(37)-N6)-threonylcarbamoyltransferase complex transferase subunit TsaD [Nitrospirota bacterium]
MESPVLILGIDTSCDDTSASVVADGRRIFSNVVSSQNEIHKKYGGIVPELASRKHIEMIWPVVDEALETAGTDPERLSAVAVCYGPGLIGSLLVGCAFAKSLSYTRSLPLIGINHLEGHIFAAFLTDEKIGFPFLSLVVSGGHTAIYRIDGYLEYAEMGHTRDDAAGEAYDKVAKMLGLGYPGGPVIDRLAEKGDAGAVEFPRPYLPGSFDFSFSGLKTAVRNFIKAGNGDFRIEDICASFQDAVVDVLVRKCEWAIKETHIKRLTLSGGVAANSELRRRMGAMTEDRDVDLFIPPVSLCTDNAAMIASAGYFHFINDRFSDMSLNPKARLPL